MAADERQKEENKSKTAAVPFSADPIHKGHIDIIRRAKEELGFREVHAAILENPSKKSRHTFSLEERMDMARKCLSHIAGAKVVSFKGLLVDYAYEQMIEDVIKGVRNEEDLKYETLLREVNDSQIRGIKHHLIKARPELAHISSTVVKAIEEAQGFTHEYVPLYVKQCLEARMSSHYIVGITGEIVTGKSYVTDKLIEIGKKRGMAAYNLDLDKIGHDILEKLQQPRYVWVREELGKCFGKEIMDEKNCVNRKVLGEIVFSALPRLEKLNRVMELPMEVRMRRELLENKGLIFFNAALIAESEKNYICNNNLILVTADKQSKERRLKLKNLTPEQIARRLGSQYNNAGKAAKLRSFISAEGYGNLWVLDNSDNSDPRNLEKLFDDIINKMDIYGELRFMGLWNRLGADGSYEAAYTRIREELAKPHRYYHTLNHVVRMLNAFDEVKDQIQNPDMVEFSIWTHDYCYAEKSKVNEEKSADFAYKLCKEAQLAEEFAKGVHKLNIVTKHNLMPANTDEAFMIDLDLLILGESDEAFDEYDDKIKQEYGWIPEEQYRTGRIAVLESFLAKGDNLYHTDYFRSKYEAQARENLERAVEKLRGC
jgi:pantetheine-phosphate adenylyltransferase/dephospho-CoA kinase